MRRWEVVLAGVAIFAALLAAALGILSWRMQIPVAGELEQIAARKGGVSGQ